MAHADGILSGSSNPLQSMQDLDRAGSCAASACDADALEYREIWFDQSGETTHLRDGGLTAVEVCIPFGDPILTSLDDQPIPGKTSNGRIVRVSGEVRCWTKLLVHRRDFEKHRPVSTKHARLEVRLCADLVAQSAELLGRDCLDFETVLVAVCAVVDPRDVPSGLPDERNLEHVLDRDSGFPLGLAFRLSHPFSLREGRLHHAEIARRTRVDHAGDCQVLPAPLPSSPEDQVVEIRRYRLMPATFNAGHHMLKEADPTWEPAVIELHERNRTSMIDSLKHLHGDTRIGEVIRNEMDLGSDPWSVLGWHNDLWLEIRHAFTTCCYYSAATAAGALGERIANHLLVDLADDCASSEDRATIEAPKAPTFHTALTILNRWDVLEPKALSLFEHLRILRNALVHFDADLYDNLRDRSLAAVTTLRDAIDAQFGVFIPRRLIPGIAGAMYLKKQVEDEPFIRRYVLPLAFAVGPRNTVAPHPPSGYWTVGEDPTVLTELDTDSEFVRLMRP